MNAPLALLSALLVGAPASLVPPASDVRPTALPTLTLPSTAAPESPVPAFGFRSALPAAAFLGGLGALALFLKRRQKIRPRHIRVIETVGLGPKRSLALVLVDDRTLLLSCSEGGVGLLESRPAPAEMLEAMKAAGAPAASTAPVRKALAKFEAQLDEAQATQDLRRKLAAGALG